MSEQKKQHNKKQDSGSFFDYLKENRTVAALLGIVAVVVIAAGILIGFLVGKGAKPASAGSPGETQSQSQTQETTTGVPDVPLEVDAHTEINKLMTEYYQAVSDGDTEKIKSMSNAWDEENLIYIQKKSAYIEAYKNIKCYTKAGPVDNSYVVYAYYDVKFNELDGLVPGLSSFLIYPGENGGYYIHEGDVDESTNAYLEVISAQDDIVDLMNEVQVKFNEAVVADENLSDYLAQLKTNLDVEVGEALAEAESVSEPEPSVSTPADNQGAAYSEVKATDVVNVRVSDSEQAEKLGKVQIGDVLKLLEEKANGWSKVEYEGKEAYIKSEFLEPVISDNEGGDGQEAGDAEEENNNGNGNADGGGASSDIPAQGTVQVAETVNIRKSASETSEKIGVCYQGGQLEIVMQQADGWTKVKFEGKTGYVKTAVLKIMK